MAEGCYHQKGSALAEVTGATGGQCKAEKKEAADAQLAAARASATANALAFAVAESAADRGDGGGAPAALLGCRAPADFRLRHAGARAGASAPAGAASAGAPASPAFYFSWRLVAVLLLVTAAALLLVTAAAYGGAVGRDAPLLQLSAAPAAAASTAVAVPAATSPTADAPLCAGGAPACAQAAWGFPDAASASSSGNILEPPLRLSVSGCGEADGAFLRACLRGRHILFIGDSLTRYQYLNLAQFLTYDDWTPFHGKGVPLTEVERVQGGSKLSWNSWSDFLAGTNERLQGYEICDCFRDIRVHPDYMLENRYYFNPRNNARVSFLFFSVPRYTRHHDLGFLNVTCGARGGCAQGGCTPKFNGCGDPAASQSYYVAEDGADAQSAFLHRLVVDSARELASRVAPIDALVLNMGYNGGPGWPREVNTFQPGNISVHREVYKSALLDVTRLLLKERLASNLVWKTTTAHTNNDYLNDVEVKWVRDNLVPLGWHLFDAFGFTQRLEGNLKNSVTDGIHFKPHVYRGLNEALALQLCGFVGAPLFAPRPRNTT
jgi:hypothetical protein